MNPAVFVDKIAEITIKDDFFRCHVDAEAHALVVLEVSIKALDADVHCHEFCTRCGDDAVE